MITIMWILSGIFYKKINHNFVNYGRYVQDFILMRCFPLMIDITKCPPSPNPHLNTSHSVSHEAIILSTKMDPNSALGAFLDISGISVRKLISMKI